MHKLILNATDLAKEGNRLADSDGEADDTCLCTDRDVVSRRTISAMERASVAVKTSPSNPQAGLGLVADAALKKGHEIPVRGSWPLTCLMFVAFC